MDETPAGLLFAKVNAELCDACGLCLRACGGSHLAQGLLTDSLDPFKGQVISAFCGHATDQQLRFRGQSGGVVTALLTFLIESNHVDQAVVNRMPENGSLRPVPFLASNKQELLESQGSKYCPVALNAVIPRDMAKNGNKLAVVGLPCHIHGLRNTQGFHRHWKEGIKVTIGLFCDRTLAYGAIDYLIKKGNSTNNDVLGFRFRDKTQGGWPGSIYISTREGKKIHVPSIERQLVKDFFTPPRCRLCFDKLNILSDIAVGDAWGVNEDKAGASVLIARTTTGISMLEQAQKAGFLSLAKIDPEQIFSGQGVEARRSLWSAFASVRRDLKGKLPDYRINSVFTEKNTGPFEAHVKRQYRWANQFVIGKTSEQIVKSVQIRQLIPTGKRTLEAQIRSVLRALKRKIRG